MDMEQASRYSCIVHIEESSFSTFVGIQILASFENMHVTSTTVAIVGKLTDGYDAKVLEWMEEIKKVPFYY